MSSIKYREGIEQAYIGELIGEKLYRRLATGCASKDQQSKLEAIADIERLTHGCLKPIAERFGIRVVESEWLPVVDRRANELAVLSWPELIEKAVRNWPPYVERFAALEASAPAGDEATIRLLVEHEVALVEFARLEKASIGSPTSIMPLDAFLGR